ncbi:hypothetical protein M378DRAFT_159607 [Amanita muscaria Koide BX008]|uniref:Uncharacterized protein n=1 Tax=Amanita muscaria (strain Koide BX008) TaxID=946122 RepID=A0A0C2XCR4_AMAMK|nr:hypothetical protein M378DRAFT_159607 [Amanita muscaria Koide BX008]
MTGDIQLSHWTTSDQPITIPLQIKILKNATSKPHATLGAAHAHAWLHLASTFVMRSRKDEATSRRGLALFLIPADKIILPYPYLCSRL